MTGDESQNDEQESPDAVEESGEQVEALPRFTRLAITRMLRKAIRAGTKYAYTCPACGREYRAWCAQMVCAHCGFDARPHTSLADLKHKPPSAAIDCDHYHTYQHRGHAEQVERKIDTRRMLNKLPERERRVLEWRFGLADGVCQHTYEECGREFNVTRERVRQIEARALRRLLRMEEAEDLRWAAKRAEREEERA